MMPQVSKYTSNAQRQKAYRERAVEARAEQLSIRGLPTLPVIPTIPGDARWRKGLTQALSYVTSVHTEMQDYYDQRSEEWQQGDRGTDFLERIQVLDDLIESIEESIR